MYLIAVAVIFSLAFGVFVSLSLADLLARRASDNYDPFEE